MKSTFGFTLRISLTLCFISSLSIAQGIGNLTEIQIRQNQLILNCTSDQVVIRAISDNVVQVNFRPNRIKNNDTPVLGDTNWTYSSAIIDTSSDPIIYKTSKFLLEIHRSPLRFAGYESSGKLLFNEPASGGFISNGLFLHAIGNNFYGIDNNATGSLTKNNGAKIDAGAQGGAGAPFVWTTDGWGMMMDTDGGSISISGSSVQYVQSSETNKIDINVFFLFGTPKEIFKGMTDVSGRAPMPPKYTFGFMNTEWGIDENELRSNVQSYRTKEIPIDAYILDFDWMAWGSDNYGEFRFGDKFPSAPSGQLKHDMDSVGLKLMGIRKPRIHTGTVQGNYAKDNGLFIDYVNDYFSGKQVGRLDFRKKETRNWYWDSFVNKGGAYQNGIIGYWNDESDEYGGNLMTLYMESSEYEGQRLFNDRRVFSLNRNFYLGAQRYAYGLWSGDINTGFASMANQRLFMLSSINLGVPWWGMDIGGFNGNPTPENYYRWIQFGAFVPIFRVHGTLNQEREPWNYGTEAEAIAKKYIRLRYELLPYIYSAARKTHELGIPMVRPLIFDYPQDAKVINISSEWMFGDNMLVYPIVAQGATVANVYFPEGEWIDAVTGQVFNGPAYVNVSVTKEDIPYFIKSGSVIPTAKVGAFVDDPNTQNILVLKGFGIGSGSTILYEDNGTNYDYEKGIHTNRIFSHQRNNDKATISIGAPAGSYVTPVRDYIADFCFTHMPDSVTVDGQLISYVSSDSVRNYSIKAWGYDEQLKSTFVRLPDNQSAHIISVYLGLDKIAPKVDTVSILTDSTLYVQFDEQVLLGTNGSSAENPANYSISGGITIRKIVSNMQQNGVTLYTSKHQKKTKYTLAISNIADQSDQHNVLNKVEFSYTMPRRMKVILQQGMNGYNGTTDTHIAEYMPNNNMGGNDLFEACRFGGSSNNDDKSALIRFDLTGIKIVDSSLVKAELLLTLADNRNGSIEKQLASYRVLTPWNEGTKSGIDGSLADPEMVTWNSAKYNVLTWNTAGGDITPSYSSVVTVNSNTQSEFAWDITDYVHYWKTNPAENFGILLKEPDPIAQNGTKVFYSKENSSSAVRPQLIFTYKDDIDDIGLSVHNGASVILPENFQLEQNYPNPFNPITTIRYAVPYSAHVKLTIHDILGREIAMLMDNEQSAGWKELQWNANNVSSGVYFYRLQSGGFAEMKKSLLLK
ncbi:MAG: TIM-barrel domain-containing protein [Bacteroidota bacterium]